MYPMISHTSDDYHVHMTYENFAYQGKRPQRNYAKEDLS